MTEKDPNFLAEAINTLKQAWPQVFGFLMSVLVCYGRLIYDDEEKPANWWIEPLVCGLITLAIVNAAGPAMTPVIESALKMMTGEEIHLKDFNFESVYPLIGGSVGLIGVKKLRAIALKRLGQNDESE